jgi:hypothetical protein
MKASERLRCDICGKFKSLDDLACGLQAEGDEMWNECKDCMCKFDLERYFPELAGELNESK